MSDIEVRQIDVHDEKVLRLWWETGKAAAADRLFDSYQPWELSREALAREHPDWKRELFAAYDGEQMVGIAVIGVPTKDNLHMLEAEVNVPVDLRRRGIGTQLLAEAEARAMALGRTTIISSTFAPPGEHGPGELFAVAHGYDVANREGFKVLQLSELASHLPELDERVSARIDDYRIVEWTDHAPDELVDDLAASLSLFLSMTPLGDMDLENLDFTPERWRDNEKHAAEIGYRELCAAALTPEGALIGFSDIDIPVADTTKASVGITMVLPEHRGHALGLAMKLATHRALMATYPECANVRTGNADVNEHMNAVNELMGYRRVEDILELQKKR
jgi:GNAT superfamily N-acetyltransferase